MLKKIHPVRFKVLDAKAGTFEARVSVFGNVDYQGDRVVKGAFDASIKRWQEAADPLPVIWSHDWQNPFAHIGYIDPDDMKEDDEGLVVKGQLDVSVNEFAEQVYNLLKDRRVKEWSFGYDVMDEAPGEDRANELRVLDIIEVGPTLKGANSLTETLGVKELQEAAEVEAVLETAMKDAREGAVKLAFDRRGDRPVELIEAAVSELADEIEDITKALARTDETPVEEPEEKSEVPTAVKNVYAPIPGSEEERRSALTAAVEEWHAAEYPNDPDNDVYNWASIVGTWPDHVVVELNHSGEETAYVSIDYTFDGDTPALGDMEPVEIELSVVGTSEEPATAGTASRGSKAGRVLSAKSEGLVRQIADAAGKLLASVEKDVAEDGDETGEKSRGTKRRDDTGVVEDSDAELKIRLKLLEAELVDDSA